MKTSGAAAGAAPVVAAGAAIGLAGYGIYRLLGGKRRKRKK